LSVAKKKGESEALSRAVKEMRQEIYRLRKPSPFFSVSMSQIVYRRAVFDRKRHYESDKFRRMPSGGCIAEAFSAVGKD
jgi:hypothetical protein